MRLVLDDVIWTLQKWGGISVYWKELTSQVAQNGGVQLSAIDLKRKKKLDFNESRINQPSLIQPQMPPFLPERYANLDYKLNERHLFHSSYYRYSKNKNAINVTTVHDFTYETHAKGLKKNVHVYQKRHALKASHGIICISEYSRDLMFELYPFTKKKKVTVIYNGISELMRDHLEKGIKDELPFPKGSYAIYIGNREAVYKNFHLSVEIVKRLKLPFVIVGGGELNDEELSRLSDVKFKHYPFASEEQLCDLYLGANFLLYPSESEGFGIPIVEAQTLRCPVITTNKTCIPEIAGNAAIMVDNVKLDNFVAEIRKLDDENYKNELIANGMLNAQNYDWKQNYEQTLSFYQELFHDSEPIGLK